MNLAPVIAQIACGLLLVLVSFRIFRKQAKAEHCDKHSHRAGRIANAIAYPSLALGIAIIIYSLVLALQMQR